MKLWVRRIIGIIVLALLYGGSLLVGPRSKGTAPLQNYFVFAFLAGVALILGELVAEKIISKDRATDPLYRRAGKLTILLLSAGVFMLMLFLLAGVLL
jgi:hypothetical protein